MSAMRRIRNLSPNGGSTENSTEDEFVTMKSDALRIRDHEKIKSDAQGLNS